jgi:Flp pilus assembly protein TadG
MLSMQHRRLSLKWLSKRFMSDSSANISIVFAFCSLAVVIAAGAGIDLARAYAAKQKLVETAVLACQYASRSSVSGTATEAGAGAYSTIVTAFINSTLQSQHFQYQQTNQIPFSSAANSATVTLNAVVPTTVMQIINVKSMPVSATSNCTLPSTTGFSEGFETSGCSGTCVYDYATSIGTQIHFWAGGSTVASANSTATATTGYVGSGGLQWVIMGYCLEIDTVGQILGTVPQGSHSAELDCDNGSGNAGNSSISTKMYLATGNYELRYNYAARIDYPNYDPVNLCGSQASDLSWANDTNASDPGASNVLRTNQINVYLDANVNGTPTTHKTMDGTQSLGGTNLIDMCVYSSGWIERSVRIKVTTAGNYWLSFAADGQNDSFGGQIDNIRFCYNTCSTLSGESLDNFPNYWLSVNNGGANKVLFEDTFESPARSPAYTGANFNTTSTLDASNGTSGTSSSGWPNLAASGWSTSPYDQVDYYLSGSAQGNQSIELDADLNSGQTTSNRTLSRAFLLDPGYYQINYNYVSDLQFTGQTTTKCTAAPTASIASSYSAWGATSGTGKNRMSGTTYSGYYDTNFVGVFVSNGQLVSTPIGGAGLNNSTSYINPNSPTSTTATVPLDSVTLSSYNSSQNNPLIDLCAYATTWQTRTAYIQIVKPGYYWLSFAALGHADNQGGAIDDVKLTALGSPYMSTPPSNAVTIPVPSPQPSAVINNYTGFLIVADPLTAPAPMQ